MCTLLLILIYSVWDAHQNESLDHTNKLYLFNPSFTRFFQTNSLEKNLIKIYGKKKSFLNSIEIIVGNGELALYKKMLYFLQYF